MRISDWSSDVCSSYLRQVRGTFVAEHDTDRALFHFFHLVGEEGSRQLPESRVLSCRRGRATRAEAARLRLPGEGGVVRISRVRNLAGAPAIVEAIAAPPAIFPDPGREGDDRQRDV